MTTCNFKGVWPISILCTSIPTFVNGCTVLTFEVPTQLYLFIFVQSNIFYCCFIQLTKDVRVGPKLGQIGPKWDFLRSISVHFGSSSQNVLTLIFKSPRLDPFVANLIQFVTNWYIPGWQFYLVDCWKFWTVLSNVSTH